MRALPIAVAEPRNIRLEIKSTAHLQMNERHTYSAIESSLI